MLTSGKHLSWAVEAFDVDERDQWHFCLDLLLRFLSYAIVYRGFSYIGSVINLASSAF